jgi:hydroxyethylthiazole kinase-like uncharacterized protein yjeF
LALTRVHAKFTVLKTRGMKVLNATQIKEADQFTIEHEPIKSIDLMERASRAFVEWFEEEFDKSRPVFIFCGTGNNGGDGLAIARILATRQWKIHTFTLRRSAGGTHDFTMNYLKLAELFEICNIEKMQDVGLSLSENDIVIDAIFGSGLSRPATGIYAKMIEFINKAPATVVSVDLPSGLFMDSSSKGGVVVQAEHVVSFQLPKLAFFMPGNAPFVKLWHLVDIGLNTDFLSNSVADYEYIEHQDVQPLIKNRPRFAHKGDFGSSLLISGSYGTMGASVLATKACLRAGAGLVTAYVPSCGYDIMQTAAPEAMVRTDVGERFLTGIPDVRQYAAIGVGPGINRNLETYRVIEQLIRQYRRPIVFDADALNIMADERNLLLGVPEGSILTPHPGEFRRLVGDWENDFEKLQKQRSLATAHKVVVVLKGAYTSIATYDEPIYFNSTGNPGMASGGSGDVLTGIITGLLSQGYSSAEAAILGVYLHGLAGDIAVKQLGEQAMVAGDIINHLPAAFLALRRKS